MSKVVCFDLGHGGSDSGATNKITGLRECDVALIVGNFARKALENVGYTVVMTRETDKDVYGPYASLVEELQARCDISDAANADVCVSIHCNGFDTNAKGTETFHHASSPNGELLAVAIQSQIMGLGGLVDRGVKNSPLYMTKHPGAVAALVELAFIDNMDDGSKLGDLSWQENFGNAVARGITDYFAGV